MQKSPQAHIIRADGRLAPALDPLFITCPWRTPEADAASTRRVFAHFGLKYVVGRGVVACRGTL